MRPWSLLVTFRVLETLKGVPSDGFEMGVFRDGSPVGDRRAWARARGRFDDPAAYWLDYFEPLGEGFEVGGCVEPPRAEIDSNYLIFFDEDGKLLDAELEFRWPGPRGSRLTISGPMYEEVFGDDDPWLVAVRREAMRLRPRG